MILPVVNTSYLIAQRGLKIQDSMDCIYACGDHSSLKYFHFKLYIAVPKCKKMSSVFHFCQLTDHKRNRRKGKQS